MSDGFSDPSSSTGITWEDHNGALVMFKVFNVELGVKTAYGEANATRANVTILDGDEAGTEYTDILVFPKLLQSSIKRNINSDVPVLGRLGRGQKKPGQSPPWILSAATDADKKIARAYLTRTDDEPPF